MRKILIISSMLMMSFAVSAQEAETCANGAGTVITGAVSGRKYCMSNIASIQWWNAASWCDALNMPMVELKDCACSSDKTDCVGFGCPEFVGVFEKKLCGWTKTPSYTTQHYFYDIMLTSGRKEHHAPNAFNHGGCPFVALCKMP